MRIGDDVSIQTCRDEGYCVMDYKIREFKKNPTTTDCTFTWSLPKYIRDQIGLGVGGKIIEVTEVLDYNNLYELYLEHKEGIDSFIGSEGIREETSPIAWDLLRLASALRSYGALD